MTYVVKSVNQFEYITLDMSERAIVKKTIISDVSINEYFWKQVISMRIVRGESS